jgi:ankyrin repeat protein
LTAFADANSDQYANWHGDKNESINPTDNFDVLSPFPLNSNFTNGNRKDSNPTVRRIREANQSKILHLVKMGLDPNWTLEIYNRAEDFFTGALEPPGKSIRVPLLCYGAERGYSRLISRLLVHGAKIEAADTDGWRALHYASFNGYSDIVQILIQHGADVHTTTHAQKSSSRLGGYVKNGTWRAQAHHLAAIHGYSQVFKILLDSHIDVNARIHGEAENAPTDPMSISQESTSQPQLYHFDPSFEGQTALHLALGHGTGFYYNGYPLDESRLQIAHWCVEAGCMVGGLVEDFSSPDIILRLQKFPALWDALRSGSR